MARNDAVGSTPYPDRFGQAWLAERGDREAIRVRYPWGFTGPMEEAPGTTPISGLQSEGDEITSLVNVHRLEASVAPEDEPPLEFTFSDDWAV